MSKKCGECRYYVSNEYSSACTALCDTTSEEQSCMNFEPPTIGDKIRQGGNRDFAEYFVYETGAVFASTLIVDTTFDTYEEAVEATEDYLNAPAESEAKDE